MVVTGDAILDPTSIVLELGKIGRWIQAVGLVVILWIVVQAVNLFFNRKRRKIMEQVGKDVARLEEKIDKIDRKLSKR